MRWRYVLICAQAPPSAPPPGLPTSQPIHGASWRRLYREKAHHLVVILRWYRACEVEMRWRYVLICAQAPPSAPPPGLPTSQPIHGASWRRLYREKAHHLVVILRWYRACEVEIWWRYERWRGGNPAHQTRPAFHTNTTSLSHQPCQCGLSSFRVLSI
jgi:hypothetical protein